MKTDAHAVPDLVRWYEGMLLLPEHFQAAARRQETLAPYLTLAAAPYAWGVGRLKVNNLENQVFEVTEVEAIMPDGMLVAYRASDGIDPPLRLDLNLAKPPPRSQTLYLVVPAWSDTALGSGGQARYRQARGPALVPADALPPVADDSDADEPWLRPSLALWSDQQGGPPAKYVALAIARIAYQESAFGYAPFQPARMWTADDQPVYDTAAKVAGWLRREAGKLDDRLNAPARTPVDRLEAARSPEHRPAAAVAPVVAAEDPDGRMLRIAGQLEQKARSLGPLIASAEAMIAGLEQRAAMLEKQAEPRASLRAIVRTLPRLEALLASSAHPFALYLSLCDVIGDIAVLGGELSLPGSIPAYEHGDALRGFEAIAAHIRAILDKLNLRYRRVQFTAVSPGAFELDLTVKSLGVAPETIGAALVVGAMFGEGQDRSAVAAWMDGAIVATAGNLESQRRRRVRGAPRKAIEAFEPFDLQAPRGTLLYLIGAAADAIDLLHGPLGIWNDDGPGAPAEIFLYVAAPPGSAGS